MLTALFLALALSYVKAFAPTPFRRPSGLLRAIQRDDKGYEIKPRDWFNGLSTDPGASLTDPRAVPPVCKEFAEKVKAGATVTFAETLKLIDDNYEYFAVPFKNGDIENPANVNTGSAKVFSFGLMTKMDEAAVLRLFGEIARDLKPDGDDHPNIRSFMRNGWSGVEFNNGLAIVSKLQAFSDTDSAMSTQAAIEGSQGWDADSEIWIP